MGKYWKATHGLRHAEGAVAAGALAGYGGYKTGEAISQGFQGHLTTAAAHAATAVVARRASAAVAKRIEPTKLNKVLFHGAAFATGFLSNQAGRSAAKYGLRSAAHGFKRPVANTHYLQGVGSGPHSPSTYYTRRAQLSSGKAYTGKAKGDLTGKPIIQIAMEMKNHMAAKRAGKPAPVVKPLQASFQLPVKRHKPVPPAPPAGPSTVMHVHNHFGPRPKDAMKKAGVVKHPVKRPVAKKEAKLKMHCPECGAMIPMGSRTCKHCGAVFTMKEFVPGPDQSLQDLQAEISNAFRDQYPNENSETKASPAPSSVYRYVSDTFADYVIVCENDKYYKVPYTDSADDETGKGVTFAPRKKWTEVARKMSTTWENKEVSAQTFVFKEGEDYRWVLLSSNGYRDRDGELISTKALERDLALWELEGSPEQPLRWWHVALTKDYSRGIEVGTTDFRMLHDHTLIESGTFIDPVVGEAIFKAQDGLAASVGFRHSLNQPNADKIFDAVNIFERSLLPKGKQSNVLVELMVN